MITGEGIFDVVIDNGVEIIYEETVVNADAGSIQFTDPDYSPATNATIVIQAGVETNLTIGEYELGLFFVNESGDYICSSTLPWTGVTNSFVAFGDDTSTPGILEGFETGDEMIFLAFNLCKYPDISGCIPARGGSTMITSGLGTFLGNCPDLKNSKFLKEFL